MRPEDDMDSYLKYMFHNMSDSRFRFMSTIEKYIKEKKKFEKETMGNSLIENEKKGIKEVTLDEINKMYPNEERQPSYQTDFIQSEVTFQDLEKNYEK